MTTTPLSLKYRTLKLGFLVEDGSKEDLIRVAKINTLLWGGIHNPIIPVSEDVESAEQLIKSIPFDIAQPIKETESIKSVLEKFPFLKAPDLYTRELFHEDWHTKKKELAYLDSLNLIEKTYQKHFKGTPFSEKSNCALVRWASDDELAGLFSILFGQYSDEFNLKHDFQDSFIRGLRAHEIEVSKDQALDDKIAGKITPIALSGLELKNYSSRYFRGDGVFVGDPKNFRDLITFWNLRAGGLLLEFLPIGNVDRFKIFIEKHLSNLDERRERQQSYERFIGFYYLDKEESDIQEIIKSLEVPKSTGLTNVGYLQHYEFLRELPTDYLSWDSSVAGLERSREKLAVTLTLPEKRFIPETDRDIHGQAFALSIDAYTSLGYEGHILNPPYIRELSEFYSREIAFNPWKVRAEKEGIGLIINAGDKHETLYPIEQGLLVRRIFELAKISSEISQAGLLTQRIIQKIDDLEGGRVFKIAGVRKLFQQLTSDSAITRGAAKDLIWNREEFKKHEDLYIEPRDSGKLTTDIVFDFLLKHDFLRSGLQLKCDHCRLISWLSLKDMNDEWICNYCGNKNLTSLHLRDRGDWKFRKSGLLAKDNNQEGAIPVILTLLTLLRVIHNMVYITSLNLKFGSKEVEIDFAVLQQRDRRKLQIAIGECKSEGGLIESKDIENLVATRAQIESLTNVECYLVFAKPVDVFQETEIAQFRKIYQDDSRLILMGNKELEPYEPYWEIDEIDPLPQKYAHSFEEMSENSFHRYLR